MNARKLFTDAGFDWEKGKMIYQAVEKDEWGDYLTSPSQITDGDPKSNTIYIDTSHPILDEEFEAASGWDCPRLFGKDQNCIYILSQQSQYTNYVRIEKIHFDLDYYIKNPQNLIPYL